MSTPTHDVRPSRAGTHSRPTQQPITIAVAALTDELARIEAELADLATTLRALSAAESTAADPTIAGAPYQQILAVLAPSQQACEPKSSASPWCRALTETRRGHPCEAETNGRPPHHHRRRARHIQPC
ncbi:hypothetical protein [Micromonospora marina]|uniref:hypothetical protein n=1 Tax=Micromonospora marina TaxID=307120 RepID=UPI0034546C06